MTADDEAREIARGLMPEARNALMGRTADTVKVRALGATLRDMRTVWLISEGEVTRDGSRVRAALVEMEARGDGE